MTVTTVAHTVIGDAESSKAALIAIRVLRARGVAIDVRLLRDLVKNRVSQAGHVAAQDYLRLRGVA